MFIKNHCPRGPLSTSTIIKLAIKN